MSSQNVVKDPPVKDTPVKDPVKDTVKEVVKDPVKPKGGSVPKGVDPELFKRMEEKYPVGVSVSTVCWKCFGQTSYDVTVAGVVCDCILK